MNNTQSLSKTNSNKLTDQSGQLPKEELAGSQNGPSKLLDSLIADWQVIRKHDPAARNWLEILFCYPGLQAITCHRFVHRLHRFGMPFVPRFIASLSRFLTGIEIHPGATIGKGVFIDHGAGVVIGETAIVGDGVVIYQAVTLGGTGKETGKRHPTVGNNVLIGAGAKILGNIQIGDQVRIGAGSVVLRDIPSDCTVVGIPGRIIRNDARSISTSNNQENLPDVEAEVISKLFERIKALEQQVQSLSQTEIAGTSTADLLTDPIETDQAIKDFLYGAGI